MPLSRVEELIARATDPLQYDRDDVSWQNEVGLSTPLGRLYWTYLSGLSSS